MVDRVTSDFLNCKVDANLTKEEQRKVVQSVELTKALVLMGYNMWSELEPGKCFQSKGEFNLIGLMTTYKKNLFNQNKTNFTFKQLQRGTMKGTLKENYKHGWMKR